MIQDEQAIEALEATFPLLSGAAFSAAYKKTLAAGMSVLIAEEGYLYEVFPDGTRKQITKIEPPTRVVPGKPIQIR